MLQLLAAKAASPAHGRVSLTVRQAVGEALKGLAAARRDIVVAGECRRAGYGLGRQTEVAAQRHLAKAEERLERAASAYLASISHQEWLMENERRVAARRAIPQGDYAPSEDERARRALVCRKADLADLIAAKKAAVAAKLRRAAARVKALATKTVKAGVVSLKEAAIQAASELLSELLKAGKAFRSSAA